MVFSLLSKNFCKWNVSKKTKLSVNVFESRKFSKNASIREIVEEKNIDRYIWRLTDLHILFSDYTNIWDVLDYQLVQIFYQSWFSGRNWTTQLKAKVFCKLQERNIYEYKQNSFLFWKVLYVIFAITFAKSTKKTLEQNFPINKRTSKHKNQPNNFPFLSFSVSPIFCVMSTCVEVSENFSADQLFQLNFT